MASGWDQRYDLEEYGHLQRQELKSWRHKFKCFFNKNIRRIVSKK